MSALPVVVTSVSLYSNVKGADKVYHLFQCQHSDGRYSVHAEYGARGTAYMMHDKTKTGRVTRAAAAALFSKVEAEKRGKGYRDISKQAPQQVPTAAGTVAVGFAAAPSAAPDLRPQSLAAALTKYLSAQPVVALAGEDALALLSSRVGSSRILALSREVRTVFQAILGDLACTSQDYVEDALDVAGATVGRGRSASLSGYLSQELARAVETARTTTAPMDSSAEFLAAALAPTMNTGLL